MHPVAGYAIQTGYGVEGAWGLGYHPGVDYPCPPGTNVLAPLGGYIIRCAWDKSYGNYVLMRVIVDGVPLDVYLCHLTSWLVKPGQNVVMGQHIAESGYTGNVRPRGKKGAHVHMEVRRAGGGYNRHDIVDPKVVYAAMSQGTPPKPLSVPVTVWNIARPRWYKPWAGRRAEVQRELRDSDDKVYAFLELFEESVIADIAAALPECARIAGRVGLEMFYNKAELKVLNVWNRYSGVANRWLQEVEFEDKASGIRFTVLNCHAPINAEGSTAKHRYGLFVQEVERKTKYKTIIVGDFNASSDSNSPKKEIRAAGYIGYKEQAVVTNENVREFMPKKQDLCDIRTRPGRISGGEVDISTNELESDHRRIRAIAVIAA